jgi:hypothetical protein
VEKNELIYIEDIKQKLILNKNLYDLNKNKIFITYYDDLFDFLKKLEHIVKDLSKFGDRCLMLNCAAISKFYVPNENLICDFAGNYSYDYRSNVISTLNFAPTNFNM